MPNGETGDGRFAEMIKQEEEAEKRRPAEKEWKTAETKGIPEFLKALALEAKFQTALQELDNVRNIHEELDEEELRLAAHEVRDDMRRTNLADFANTIKEMKPRLLAEMDNLTKSYIAAKTDDEKKV